MITLLPGNEPHITRYLKLIEWLRTQDVSKQYTERHHVVPRCMGGDNNNENIIEISTKAHLILHLILWKAYQGIQPWGGKMASAFNMMRAPSKALPNRRSRLTARQYQRMREELSLHMSETTFWRTPEGRKVNGDAHRGKGKDSDETRRKKSESNKKPKSESHKASMRKPKSDEHRKALDAAKIKLREEDPEAYKMSPEVREVWLQKLRDNAQDHERMMRIGQSHHQTRYHQHLIFLLDYFEQEEINLMIVGRRVRSKRTKKDIFLTELGEMNIKRIYARLYGEEKLHEKGLTLELSPKKKEQVRKILEAKGQLFLHNDLSTHRARTLDLQEDHSRCTSSRH